MGRTTILAATIAAAALACSDAKPGTAPPDAGQGGGLMRIQEAKQIIGQRTPVIDIFWFAIRP